MRTTPDRESSVPDVMTRIAHLSPGEGADLLLHSFLSVLNGLDAGAASRLRDEIATRFGGRHCNQQLCALMLELLNGHLARRTVGAAA